jgi:replication factor A1
MTALDSLARIALRQNIDSSMFFNSIVDAWKHEESNLKNLVITCRKKSPNTAIFLFTIKQKVIAQFPVPEQLLREKDPINEYIDTLPLSVRNPVIKNPVIKNPKIINLKQKYKNVDLKARVIEISGPKAVHTKFGTQVYVSNVLIADETGTITLCLWNQQINKVSVGDVIKVEKGRVASFRGERQLRLGRSGKISVIEEKGFPTIEQLAKNKQQKDGSALI